MTINSIVRDAGPFIGNGLLVPYTFLFKVFQPSDVLVFVQTGTGTVDWVLGTDYTLALNADQDANPGGVVTPTAALPTGWSLQIISVIQALQQLSIQNGGGFYPQSIEDALDKLTILVQQNGYSSLANTLRVPDFGVLPNLPNAAGRANQFLGFDVAGNPTCSLMAPGTAAEVLAQLASPTVNLGSALVEQAADTAGTQPMTLFNIIKERTSFTRYLSAAKQVDVLSGALTLDCSTELATALAERAGKKLTIPGMVRVNSGSFLVANGSSLEGEGPYNTGLVCYGTNAPILLARGTGVSISRLGLSYSARQLVGTAPNSHAIHCQDLSDGSVLEKLWIYNATCGVHCNNGGYNLDGTGPSNFVYSTAIRDSRIDFYSLAAMYLSGVGNSGNEIDNVYTINNNTNLATYGVYLENWDDGIVNQLNVEHCTPSSVPLYLGTCRNLTFNGLHFEGLTLSTNYEAFIDLAGSQADIRGLSFVFNTINATDLFALVKLNNSAVKIANYQERNNTVTTPSLPIIYSVASQCTARLLQGKTSAFTLPHSGLSFVANGNQNVIVENESSRFGGPIVSDIGYPIILAYSASIATDCAYGSTFVVTATNGAAFAMTNPTDATTGQRIRYRIRNTSGVALGAITWGTAFKLAAWTSPATGFSRWIEFEFDGTNWIESGRAAADIPN